MVISVKPSPQISDLSRAYWSAALEGRFNLQHCAACGAVRHYPRLLCSICYSDATIWKQASGHGHVHSWTVAHHAFHPAFADQLPYTLVTVDLDEGVRALGIWHGPAPKIGMPVQGRFLAREDTADLIFEPAQT